jgi:ABC-2 type transport system ATP-binding protein
MMAQDTALLQVQHIEKYFDGTPVWTSLSFQLPQQGLCAVLGQNGRGKSVLLQVLAGAIYPDAGQVQLYHDASWHTIASAPWLRQYIGWMPEQLYFWPDYTVQQAIQLAADIKQCHDEVDQQIQHFHLQPVAHKRLQHISLGYQRRLSLALASMGSPKLLLLDEPTNGLDPSEADVLLQFILQARQKWSLVMVSHRLDEVQQVANQVLVLHQGGYQFAPCPAQLKEYYAQFSS